MRSTKPGKKFQFFVSTDIVFSSHSGYRVCARRPCWRNKTIEYICIKIEYISQRKIILLFRSSNMAVVYTLYTLFLVSCPNPHRAVQPTYTNAIPVWLLNRALSFSSKSLLYMMTDLSLYNGVSEISVFFSSF